MERIIPFYSLVIFGVFAAACSQLLLKKSAERTYVSWVASIINWRVILAYTIFFFSLLINITAMSYGVKLKDLPILEALGYVFVPSLSWFILKENVSKTTILSILFILVGIIIFYI